MPSTPSLPSGHLCTSCGLCVSACSRHAIRLSYDADGFLRPEVDENACIGCGACQKLCAKLSVSLDPRNGVEHYQAWHVDADTRRKSTSGGFCMALAESFIAAGGSVYGVGMGAELRPAYMAVEKREDLGKIQGTCYLQANPGFVYRDVLVRLREGRQILFIGMPCQVSALKLLTKNPPNLYTVDIACFGVPSRNVLLSVLRDEVASPQEAASVRFRVKKGGWRHSTTRITLKTGETRDTDNFVRAFYTKLCMNEACYGCDFTPDARPGDLSTGDFWGHRDQEGDGSENGISCVFANTEKGKFLLEQARPLLEVSPVPESQALQNGGYNRKDQKSVSMKERRRFLLALRENKMSSIIRRYVYSNGSPRRSLRLMGYTYYIPECLYSAAKALARLGKR